MVTLTHDGERFWCKCTLNDHLYPKTSHFRWEPQKKLWYTFDIKVAVRLRRFADPLAEKEIAKVCLTQTPWTGRIDHPKRKTPKPWQIDGVMFALERNRSYLAYDPRLGKTPMAAMIINSEATNCIYICPPFMVETTREMLQDWMMHGLHVAKFRYPTKNEFPNVLVVPDNQLQKRTTRDAIKAFKTHSEYVHRPVRLIVDEAHRFKNMKAKRTDALFNGVVPHFDKITFMSGSPRPNRNMELYPVLSYLAPETIGFMSEFEFGRRYCDGQQKTIYLKGGPKKVWQFLGSTNNEELGKRVKPAFMLRVRRKDVGQLPKIEEVVVIDDTLPPTVARLDKKLLAWFSPDDVMNGDDAHIATYRKELGIAKVPFAVSYIKELLEDTNENLLVFAWHKTVIRELQDGLKAYNPMRIDGSTGSAMRGEQVKEFQEDGEKRLLIANIQAGGIGFDISKADRVIFVEFSYVPGDNDQAADRAFHLSKTENVFAQYLVYKNSVDRTILEGNLEKRKTEAEL